VTQQERAEVEFAPLPPTQRSQGRTEAIALFDVLHDRPNDWARVAQNVPRTEAVRLRRWTTRLAAPVEIAQRRSPSHRSWDVWARWVDE
jgi:hypothetical protein